jgi:hypothetical protein
MSEAKKVFSAHLLKRRYSMRERNFDQRRLPFPTRIVYLSGRPIEEYIIPEHKKADILRALYPFVPRPSLDDVMFDIHAEKKFIVREFMVTREDEMNMLVSPYYYESGGTVIDWIPPDYED